MFVLSYQGELQGPFQTANEAAQYGESNKRLGREWSIIPVKEPEQREIVFETLGSHAPPQRLKGRTA